MSSLLAISPIDGRYYKSTQNLSLFFSEYALIKYRVQVEVEYFISLSELPLPQLEELSLDSQNFSFLRNLYLDFNENDAQEIKDIETVTNHDVKAVEYYLKNKFKSLGLGKYIEFIHFGLTSQDINNTALPLSLKDVMNQIYYPNIIQTIEIVHKLSKEWENIPMLSRTHGQPATPTKLGKELMVFEERLQQQLVQLKTIPYAAKFGGAVGNFNAHHVAYPNIDWKEFADEFVNQKLGLTRSNPTTQIEHYDHLAALFDSLRRINTILIDMNRDIWQYISMDYFKQRINKEQTGSSTMPHKVNPINFENSESNLGMANAIFCYLSQKLPISRLQRDLTDSSALRNIGTPFGHTIIALTQCQIGLNKLIINKERIDRDLEENWMVVAEGIQTILRREFYPNPYECLKKLTRNHKKVTKEIMDNFINDLEISDKVKEELRSITPFNYTGI